MKTTTATYTVTSTFQTPEGTTIRMTVGTYRSLHIAQNAARVYPNCTVTAR